MARSGAIDPMTGTAMVMYGSPNTGGGAGGGNNSGRYARGGQGGSGIVMIAYDTA